MRLYTHEKQSRISLLLVHDAFTDIDIKYWKVQQDSGVVLGAWRAKHVISILCSERTNVFSNRWL